MAGVTINLEPLKRILEKIQDYFSNLSQNEMIGCGIIALGIILLIASLFLK